jgi:hypothetical protein
MPLTNEQQQQVIRHLEAKNAEITCKVCKKGTLKVHSEMVCTPLAENSGIGLKIYARDVVSLIQVVCPECWHVEHFMAEGVLKS